MRTLTLRAIIKLLPVAVFTSSAFCSENTEGRAEELYFDAKLFRSNNINENVIARLSHSNAIAPGVYKADLYINDHFVERTNIKFVSQKNEEVIPCFEKKTLVSAGVILREDIADNLNRAENCVFLTDVTKGGSTKFNLANLRLDLYVPQSEMITIPRGYVPPDNLDAGSTVGYVNYLANVFHVSYSGNNTPNQDSAWMSLNGGINMGMWQYRQLSNLNWDKQQGSSWQRIRSYVQRPLPSFGSQFSAGELITNGRFFSGLSYNGVNLATDDRMLPDSMQGYAPVVRGVATTTSKVTVYQNGQQIYQTTVSAGAFAIGDLYPTSYSGDLTVDVNGADGSHSQFTVPFSAIPESMRAGLSRFDVALGRTRDSGEKSLFSDFTWQHGLSNSTTLNTGIRVADEYQSAMTGGVYSNEWGALGLDLTWSHAKLPVEGYVDGWMAHLSYSKTIQATDTTISLAGYRYSTAGYRDLSDVLGIRKAYAEYQLWNSASYQQQSRFDVSMSQSMKDYGNLFLSGSLQNYRNSQKTDKQLQFGYSNGFSNGISYNISVGRQYMNSGDDQRHSETMTSVSFSVPLGAANSHLSSINSSWTHSSNGGDQYQSTVSGTVDEEQTLNYTVGAQHNEAYNQTVLNGSLQKRFSGMNAGVNVSRGNQYWQASGSMQGALAIHQGGVTLGPYLGDTFALVEAKGATGASVYNSAQSRIDDNGYALIPSLTPYRYSTITLSPQGMASNVDIVENEQRVAPVAGAAIKVAFKTISGVAIIIKATQENNEPVPLGAEVYDEQGIAKGMVAQNGQLYIRSEKKDNRLTIKWGDNSDEICRLDYQISESELKDTFIKKTATCEKISNNIQVKM